MTKTEIEYVKKLENIKNKVKNQVGKEQPSGFKLLTHYFPKDAKDQIDDIFAIIESEISQLKEQIKKEEQPLKSAEEKIDLMQYMTNALYYAYNAPTNSLVVPEFDKWVEDQIEGINEYFKSQPIKDITDEEIKEWAIKDVHPVFKHGGVEFDIAYNARIKGAKWIRKLLTGK